VVRYIHPGGRAILEALLANVPTKLTAFSATDSAVGIPVELYLSNGPGVPPVPIPVVVLGGTNSVPAAVLGSLGFQLQQDSSSFGLIVTQKIGGSIIDERQVQGDSNAQFHQSAFDKTIFVRELKRDTTWNSVKSAAPGASAVQADTGAIATGADSQLEINLAVSDTNAVGKGLVVEHRNAANSATLQNLGGCASPGNQSLIFGKYALLASERIRVLTGTAAGAASSMYISAIGFRLAS